MHLLCFFFGWGGSRAATIAWGMSALASNQGAVAYLVEDILELVLCQSTALDVLDRAQILGHSLAVLLAHWLHLLLAQLLPNTWVISQIRLGTHNQAWHTGAVMVNFGKPLFADVLERGRRGDGETDEEDIGLGVGERTQPVVIFLPSGVEETKSIWLIADPGEISCCPEVGETQLT